MTAETEAKYVQAVHHWLETAVIGWNLCPFAGREVSAGRVRFAVTPAQTEEALLLALQDELEFLTAHPEIETTLLIHPYVLNDFLDYNQFLELADLLLQDQGLEGVIQIASFHPNYQFAGTDPDEVTNSTNRSPVPLLHLLREDSLEKAIEAYPDVDEIPNRNMDLMRKLGPSKVEKVLKLSSSLLPDESVP